MKFTLKHYENEDVKLNGQVRETLSGLEIDFEGFGNPIFIEVGENGNPVVYLWTDEPAENDGDAQVKVEINYHKKSGTIQ